MENDWNVFAPVEEYTKTSVSTNERQSCGKTWQYDIAYYMSDEYFKCIIFIIAYS